MENSVSVCAERMKRECPQIANGNILLIMRTHRLLEAAINSNNHHHHHKDFRI